VANRRRPVAIPAAEDGKYCPLAAWKAWESEVRSRSGEAAFAFPDLRSLREPSQSLSPPALSHVVRLRARAALLRGRYSFTSLRIGFIRTAARASVPMHLVYQQAGVQALQSIELHYRRERLLQHNLIDHLGL
jgi:hypothetical protein